MDPPPRASQVISRAPFCNSGDERAVRIDHTDSVAVPYVLADHMLKEPALSPARRPNNMQMSAAGFGRQDLIATVKITAQ